MRRRHAYENNPVTFGGAFHYAKLKLRLSRGNIHLPLPLPVPPTPGTPFDPYARADEVEIICLLYNTYTPRGTVQIVLSRRQNVCRH